MFEILEHTADIGIRVRAATLPELFEQAALALQAVVLDASWVRPLETYPLSAEGEDDPALLVNFLSDVLFLLDARRVAFAGVKVEHLDPHSVRAHAAGEPRDATRHPPRVIVKGVTYHQFRLDRTPEGWLAEVFLDI